MSARRGAKNELELAVETRLREQLESMDTAMGDGKPLWDAKSRVELFKIATDYIVKRYGTNGNGVGDKLG